jgi:hypothetical protein
METTYEPLHIGKLNLKYHELAYKFYLNHYFPRSFKYGDGVKFLGYVETSAEPGRDLTINELSP